MSVSADVAWIKANGLGAVMIFGFESNANVVLMGQLIDDLYGPGSWVHVAQS